MHTHAYRRFNRLGVGTAVGALVTSGLLLAATAPAANAVTVTFVRADQIDLSETRATGHNDFLADGIHVWTESNTSTDKSAGYFDVNMPLAAVGEPSLGWTPTATPVAGTLKPSVQLKTDFDADGNIDGILVGEPTYENGAPLYGTDWWLSNASDQFAKDGAPSHVGGSGSDNHGTLAQWRAAFPNAQVIESGWSLGSGAKGDGTITRIFLGDRRYYFTTGATPATTSIHKSLVNTALTRATGHNEFQGTGIRVWTEGSTGTDKAAGYFESDIPLAESGKSSLDFTNTTAGSGGQVPGLQLVTDFDNDGTADGTLVGEPLYPGQYWLPKTKLDNTAVANWVKDLAPRKSGEPGVQAYMGGIGTPAEWRAQFPDAQILQVGYSLGSGAKGDGILNSITVGLSKFEFSGANRRPSTSNLTATTPAGTSVTVNLTGSDPDGDALTYSSTVGKVAANKLTYTAPADATGSKVVPFTVTDSQGGTQDGTLTVAVTKADSKSTLTIAPGKITTKSKQVRGTVKVTSTGAVTGGTVTLFDGAKQVGTGVLANDGSVLIQLTKKLKKGTHTITAVFAGTPSTTGSQAEVVVKVKKKKAPKKG